MNDTRLARPRFPRPGGLLRLLLLTPLWAVPFALFFGTLFGPSWHLYRLLYLESLVFAYAIRLALWAVGRWVSPPLVAREGDKAWLPITVAHVLGAILGSYVAAFVIQQLWQPGFLTNIHGLIAVGLWSLLFGLLFSGLILARAFHHNAVERAAQVERIRADLVRAELRALRAQVNPHFLFNTLNSIAALIAENPAAAEDLTTRLADVFRYALGATSHEQVRLADELEFTHTYLAIERVRFGERLRIEESIAPGLADVPVPPLLLQPLVENAVRYAVGPRSTGGCVRIEAAAVAGTLQLVVADDGPGFVPGGTPQGHGVGLESVRERLRLAGEGHALSIEQPAAGGTRIVITLPLAPAIPAPLPSPSEAAR